MVIRLKENLKLGDKKQFILTFKNHEKIKIKAIVKELKNLIFHPCPFFFMNEKP